MFTQSAHSRLSGVANASGGDKGGFDIDRWHAARDALKRLYGDLPDAGFSALMGDVARRVAGASAARRAELRARDAFRRNDPLWFANPGRPVYCAYAGRFGGTLRGCLEHIPYLQELNVGLLHLMLDDVAQDGHEDLRDLADALRRVDMSLVLDAACDPAISTDPRAFVAMLDVFLDLANIGVDGFRLHPATAPWMPDAVLAWRHLIGMMAPGAFLLAETGVRSHLVYNSPAMAALWAAIAEGDGAIFDDALRGMAGEPSHRWLNYARRHEGIIWNVPGADAARQRQWTRFYAGGESFADGLSFPVGAGDVSVCGMAASLCGVADDAFGLDRLKLVYSVVYALDGVPMIYMGDEIALANAELTGPDPDTRALHRPDMDWNAANAADVGTTQQGEMFDHLCMLSDILMALPDLARAGPAQPLPGRDGPVLAISRSLPKGRFLCLANLSNETRTVRLPRPATDLFDGLRLAGRTALPPWQALWLHET